MKSLSPILVLAMCVPALCAGVQAQTPQAQSTQLQTSQAPPPGPEGEVVIKVSVRLVMVDAQVTGRKPHRVLGSLQPGDFQVYEDGVRQEITSFSQDTLPLSVVLLFDLTDSVRPVLRSLARGAAQVLRQLKPEDEVAVMVYSASARLLQDFTTDRALAASAIERASKMKSGEAAFFNEGVYQAAMQSARSQNPSSRRLVLWMTDDVPNIPSEDIRRRVGRSLGKGPLHTEKEAIEELFRTGAVLCTLLQRSALSDASPVWSMNSNAVLDRMMYPPGKVARYTEETGGQVMESSNKEADKKFAELIDAVRRRYSLGYRPSAVQPQGKFCNIVVKVAPEVRQREGKLIVAAKRGYYR